MFQGLTLTEVVFFALAFGAVLGIAKSTLKKIGEDAKNGKASPSSGFSALACIAIIIMLTVFGGWFVYELTSDIDKHIERLTTSLSR